MVHNNLEQSVPGRDNNNQEAAGHESHHKFTDEFLSEKVGNASLNNTGKGALDNESAQSSVIPNLQISDGAPRITGFMQQPGNGEAIVENAIENAHKSVDMWMFHLSDPAAAQALMDAHDKNG